jgi:hypothetical protein
MRTFKIIIAIFACLAFASNVLACNQGSQPSIIHSVVDSTKVRQFELISPTPNPSRGATTVGFTNSKQITYNFIVLNIYGDTAYRMAMNQSADPGSHSFTIPAGTLIPGTYLCSLQVGKAVLLMKFSVVK